MAVSDHLAERRHLRLWWGFGHLQRSAVELAEAGHWVDFRTVRRRSMWHLLKKTNASRTLRYEGSFTYPISLVFSTTAIYVQHNLLQTHLQIKI